MPPKLRGAVFPTGGGYGIRWPEDGRRPQQSGFRTKTEARVWFDTHVAPRLRRGGPSPHITLDAFCDLFLERHGATVSERTTATLTVRLAPARKTFGTWTSSELEGAAGDIARWRAGLSDTSRFRLTLALRQALAAAIRWGYITRNPAVDAGPNPERRADELRPFTRAEIEKLAVELGPVYGPLCVFNTETGLRTKRVGRGRAPRHRSRRARRRCAAPLRRRRPHAVPEDAAPARAADSARRGCPRCAAAASGHTAAVPRHQGRPHRPGHLAHPRVVFRARGSRHRPPRALPPAPHLRDRGARGRRVDLPARPADGRLGEDQSIAPTGTSHTTPRTTSVCCSPSVLALIWRRSPAT
jgi:hypothetical protein